MKKVFTKLTCLMVATLAMGCSPIKTSSSSAKKTSSSQNNQSTSKPTSTSKTPSSTSQHQHEWDTEWSYDGTNHYHACKGCNNKNDLGAHEFPEEEWETVNLGTKLNDPFFRHSTIKMKTCSVCGYNKTDNADILPRLNFQCDNPSEVSFATSATSTDSATRPNVSGKYSLDNCGEDYRFAEVPGEMKVRGNQTAGFPKKGFRIKFGTARNILGLNNNKKFKKWVLLADAKDSCIIRTGIGLSAVDAI